MANNSKYQEQQNDIETGAQYMNTPAVEHMALLFKDCCDTIETDPVTHEIITDIESEFYNIGFGYAFDRMLGHGHRGLVSAQNEAYKKEVNLKLAKEKDELLNDGFASEYQLNAQKYFDEQDRRATAIGVVYNTLEQAYNEAVGHFFDWQQWEVDQKEYATKMNDTRKTATKYTAKNFPHFIRDRI